MNTLPLYATHACKTCKRLHEFRLQGSRPGSVNYGGVGCKTQWYPTTSELEQLHADAAAKSASAAEQRHAAAVADATDFHAVLPRESQPAPPSNGAHASQPAPRLPGALVPVKHVHDERARAESAETRLAIVEGELRDALAEIQRLRTARNSAPPIDKETRFFIGAGRWAGLSKLIEEMGELLQVCGKLIATHGEAQHWDGTDLHRRFEDELGDVLGAADFVLEEGREAISVARVFARRQRKLARFHEWHRGQVEPSTESTP